MVAAMTRSNRPRQRTAPKTTPTLFPAAGAATAVSE
jgi:hypothetical protein